jgi:hypothetical protein
MLAPLVVALLSSLPLASEPGRAVWIAPARAPQAATAEPAWIWAQAPGKPAPTTQNAPAESVSLTRELTIPPGTKPVRARAWLAADNSAELLIGSQRVLSSKSWSAPTNSEIDPALLSASATLTIRASNIAASGARPSVDPAGAAMLLTVTLDDGRTITIATDASWKGSVDGVNAESTPAVVLGPLSVAPWNLSASALTEPEPCPRLRRSFTLAEAPTAASVRVIGLGHYELRCNGRVVGDSVINQAWSQYDKTLYWQTFDLAPYLKAGENVLAVTLGNSFWSVGPVNDAKRFSKTDATPDFSEGQPFLLWIDGSATVRGETVPIVTDERWLAAPGPLTFSHIYGGEDFDARLDTFGWDLAGATPDGWKPVATAKQPAATLAELPSPPIRTFETFDPAEIKAIDERTFTYVFPQNCSSLLRFEIDGKPGQRVRFKPCEYMQADGRVRFTYTWGTGKDIWHDYTLAGRGPEKHQTVFCYVGAQFVQVEGAVPEGKPNPLGLPVLRSLQMVHTRAACEEVGTFATGDRIQDGAFRLIDWSIKTNMSHVPTDCPHREKNGWLEQNWHMARAISYRYDIHGWFTKVCRDMRDAQIAGGQDDGFIPTNAPWYLVGRPRHDTYNDAPEWGIASVMVPWHLYEWYGDAKPLEASFESMKRYVDYLERIAKDGIISSNLGDWYDYGHGKGDGPSQWTPSEVSATAIWAMGAKTVADAARVLNKPDDERKYRAMFETIRTNFVAKFYDPMTATIKHGGSCQAGTSAAICLDLIPKADIPRAIKAVLTDLEARKWQQTTGEVLHIFLVRALSEHGGREGIDALHRVYARTERGSYGFMVESGLTTLPESWDAKPGTGNSMSHLMLGQLMEWHFAYVAGIRQAPNSIGWSSIVIAPQPGPRGEDGKPLLPRASARFRTPRGEIRVEWKIERSTFELACFSPPGVNARIVMPDGTERNKDTQDQVFTCTWK